MDELNNMSIYDHADPRQMLFLEVFSNVKVLRDYWISPDKTLKNPTKPKPQY